MSTFPHPVRLRKRVFELRGWISAALGLPMCVAVVFSRPWFPSGSWCSALGGFLGWLLLGAGIFLRLWATLYIGGRKSLELVTAGPYALCRHPLYLASFLIMAALGLFLLSASLLALAVILSLFYAYAVIPSEEQHALECFGGAYRAYAGITPRFLPRSVRLARPGIVPVKVAACLREFARAYGLIALAAAVYLLADCRARTWWPVVFHLP